ncbi:MAG: hypothetical protein U0800_25975 [Isosphaeraceae bacterium]
MSRAARWFALLLPPAALHLVATTQELAGPVNHDDEMAWVANSYYGELAFSGDFGNPDWQLLPAKDSPPLGKYAFALALRMIDRPIRSIEPLAAWYGLYRDQPGAWGTGEAYERRRAIAERINPARIPSVRSRAYRPIGDDQLLACRRVARIGGMLAALGVASVGLAIRGPATGLIAGLAFAVHPITIPVSLVALFDTMAVAWSILAIRLLMATVEAVGWRRSVLAIGLGLSMAAAVGTKMNALIVAAATGSTALFLAGRALRKEQKPAIALALSISMAIALAAFVAVNPALHPDIVGGLADLFRLPAETTRVQAGFLDGFLGTFGEKFGAVGALLVGFRAGSWPLLGIGVISTLAAIADRAKPGRWIVVGWFWSSLVLVVAWIPFPWSRYALPVVPAACLIAADSLAALAGRVGRLRPSASPSQPEGGSATMSGR